MFTLKWTESAQQKYDELKTAAEAALKSRTSKGKSKSSKQEGLFKQVHKTLDLLRADPRHPGCKRTNTIRFPILTIRKRRYLKRMLRIRRRVPIGSSGVTVRASTK